MGRVAIPARFSKGGIMAKKQYFFICDTETTIAQTIADFAGIIVDKQGKEYNRIAVLVSKHYGYHKLFYDKNSAQEIWTLKGLKRRNEAYKNMLENGSRMMATVRAINQWLNRALVTYPDLIFVAYNAEFDQRMMVNTGIDYNFRNQFCLWRAAVHRVTNDKDYISHCLNRKWITAKLNVRTNAEAMSEFAQNRELPDEPHTALEDVLDFELPIFKWLLKHKSWKSYSQLGYNWQAWQLKNLVIPK